MTILVHEDFTPKFILGLCMIGFGTAAGSWLLLWAGGRFAAKAPKATVPRSLLAWLLCAVCATVVYLLFVAAPEAAGKRVGIESAAAFVVLSIVGNLLIVRWIFAISFARALLALTPLLAVSLVLGVALVVPAMRRAEDSARVRRLHMRVRELAQGLDAFRQDERFYPGQDDVRRLGFGEGQITGSQCAAMALFKIDQSGKGNPDVGYASCVLPRDLVTFEGRYPTLSDGAKDPMPICYYPARLGESGLKQFVEADNAAYTRGREGGNFYEFIRDRRARGEHPHNAGRFLLIAPGPDRKYFTDDDVVNWTKDDVIR